VEKRLKRGGSRPTKLSLKIAREQRTSRSNNTRGNFSHNDRCLRDQARQEIGDYGGERLGFGKFEDWKRNQTARY